jgi:type IV secretion system protein VirB2
MQLIDLIKDGRIGRRVGQIGVGAGYWILQYRFGDAADNDARKARLAVLALVAGLLVLDPSLAMAEDATTNPWSGVMKKITDSVTGPLGQSLGVIAIMVMGIMAMFGRLAWDMALKVIFGVLLVFSASTIVNWVTGGTTPTTY